jgi:eukaryotic-like serine/threonine-protein kinase
MSISVGTRLGPYEIISAIGSGGMGEVYRAKDTRLNRDVAVKVLRPIFSSSQERLKRFEQEARTAGLLSHPNILAIYDVGTEDESPYLVSELLEGETLRKKLANGAIPQRRAVEFAMQIARGIAAAHQRGIIHRDLKPENVFITKDGHLKVLDFGLAKLTLPDLESTDQSQHQTMSRLTSEGVVMGTVGYMSPEQVQGLPVDQRSDVFSFGAVLYEMLSSKRAFGGNSSIEVLNAILKEEPTELSESNENFPQTLQRIVRSCLEKNPDDRFQSMRDLALAFEAISFSSGSNRISGLEKETAKASVLRFQRITFRHGHIWSARFAPDGNTIVYGASWNGEPYKLFLTRTDASESIPLSLPDSDILSISGKGEMAISVGRHFDVGNTNSGTLARLPITGGAPRELLDDIQDADWSADGETLVIARRKEGYYCLELSSGDEIYRTNGWVSHPRFSRDGKLIAFADHPVYGDDAGSIVVVNQSGNAQVLSEDWGNLQGLAWSPDGSEVWFAGGKGSDDAMLYAVSHPGRVRPILEAPTTVALYDVSADGHVLISRVTQKRGISAVIAEDAREVDLSYLNWSFPRALSPDGKKLLFVEHGGARISNTVCIRKTDGSPPVQIGDGFAMDISPDWKWALTVTKQSPVVLLPVGIGKQRILPNESLGCTWAGWFPDGKRILFASAEKSQATRYYIQEVADGKPVPVPYKGSMLLHIYMTNAISPDGKLVAGWDEDRNLTIFSLEGGEPHRVPDTPTGYIGSGWSADSNSIYIFHPAGVSAKILHVDWKTGKRELWKEIRPSDPGGIQGLSPILFTPDLQSYVYSYRRVLCDLYLVNGLR